MLAALFRAFGSGIAIPGGKTAAGAAPVPVNKSKRAGPGKDPH